MDGFDADVLIYAAVPDHPLGRRVLALLDDNPSASAIMTSKVGSVLLLPEMLTKPFRLGATVELAALGAILARVELHVLDHSTAQLAVALAASYRLKAGDAVHLATAVMLGADRFLTNNRKDFLPTITEIAITYPDDLPEPCRPQGP